MRETARNYLTSAGVKQNQYLLETSAVVEAPIAQKAHNITKSTNIQYETLSIMNMIHAIRNMSSFATKNVYCFPIVMRLTTRERPCVMYIHLCAIGNILKSKIPSTKPTRTPASHGNNVNNPNLNNPSLEP